MYNWIHLKPAEAAKCSFNFCKTHKATLLAQIQDDGQLQQFLCETDEVRSGVARLPEMFKDQTIEEFWAWMLIYSMLHVWFLAEID